MSFAVHRRGMEIEALVRMALFRRMKSTIKDWLKVLILLLDEAAAVGLVLIVLWVLGIAIPLPIAVVAALLLGGLVFVIYKAVIPTFHKKQVTGAEGLIGLEGEVIEPLTPVGVIRASGEYWKAKSVGENIATGEEVEILGMKGLTLMVKPRDQQLRGILSTSPPLSPSP